jgi:hypothetical protein
MNGGRLLRSVMTGTDYNTPYDKCPWDGNSLVEDSDKTTKALASLSITSKAVTAKVK